MNAYEYEDLVGQGSFGKVYKGRRRYTGHVLALKFISKFKKPEREISKLREEIRILRQVDHPNVVQLLDAIETDGEFCVVTEFAQGDLYELLEEDKRVPEPVVQTIAKELVRALFYLHSMRIIHRDMKPSNVLIASDGRVKLCDFGFARALSPKTIMVTSIKGTPLYMSPELVREKPYNHTVDLWSLGVILFELYVGQPPFCTDNMYSLIKLIVSSEVQYPDTCSPEFRSFLQGLLVKDCQKRLQWPNLLNHPFVGETEQARAQREAIEKNPLYNPRFRLQRCLAQSHDDLSTSLRSLPSSEENSPGSQAAAVDRNNDPDSSYRHVRRSVPTTPRKAAEVQSLRNTMSNIDTSSPVVSPISNELKTDRVKLSPASRFRETKVVKQLSYNDFITDPSEEVGTFEEDEWIRLEEQAASEENWDAIASMCCDPNLSENILRCITAACNITMPSNGQHDAAPRSTKFLHYALKVYTLLLNSPVAQSHELLADANHIAHHDFITTGIIRFLVKFSSFSQHMDMGLLLSALGAGTAVMHTKINDFHGSATQPQGALVRNVVQLFEIASSFILIKEPWRGPVRGELDVLVETSAIQCCLVVLRFVIDVYPKLWRAISPHILGRSKLPLRLTRLLQILDETGNFKVETSQGLPNDNLLASTPVNEAAADLPAARTGEGMEGKGQLAKLALRLFALLVHPEATCVPSRLAAFPLTFPFDDNDEYDPNPELWDGNLFGSGKLKRLVERAKEAEYVASLGQAIRVAGAQALLEQLSLFDLLLECAKHNFAASWMAKYLDYTDILCVLCPVITTSGELAYRTANSYELLDSFLVVGARGGEEAAYALVVMSRLARRRLLTVPMCCNCADLCIQLVSKEDPSDQEAIVLLAAATLLMSVLNRFSFEYKLLLSEAQALVVEEREKLNRLTSDILGNLTKEAFLRGLSRLCYLSSPGSQHRGHPMQNVGYVFAEFSKQDVPGSLMLSIMRIARHSGGEPTQKAMADAIVNAGLLSTLSETVVPNFFKSPIEHEVHSGPEVTTDKFLKQDAKDADIVALSPTGVVALLQLVHELVRGNFTINLNRILTNETLLCWMIDLLHATYLQRLVAFPPALGGSKAGLTLLIQQLYDVLSQLFTSTLSDSTQKRVRQVLYTRRFLIKSIRSFAFVKASHLPEAELVYDAPLKFQAILVTETDHFARQFVENGGPAQIKELGFLSFHGQALKSGTTISDVHEQAHLDIVLSALHILTQLAGRPEYHAKIIELDFSLELRDLLNHKAAIVRSETCRLFGKLCKASAEFYPTLIQALPPTAHPSNSTGRSASLLGAITNNRHDLLLHLIARCEDEDPETRKLACFAIGNAAYHSDLLYADLAVAVPLLAALLTDSERKTRANSASAIGNLVRWSGSLCDNLLRANVPSRMVDIIQSDSDIQARRKALFSLGILVAYKPCREIIVPLLSPSPEVWLDNIGANDEYCNAYAKRVAARLEQPPIMV